MMVGIVGPSRRLPVGLRLVGLNVALLCARRMVRWLDGYHIRSPFVNHLLYFTQVGVLMYFLNTMFARILRDI
jgi:hypothetical protein